MANLITLGTESTPVIKGKRFGTSYIEAAWNEKTNKVIVQISSLIDDRAFQEEMDVQEAIARWKMVTGTPLFN